MQSLWDRAHGLPGQLRNTSTVKVDKTTRGFKFHAAAQSGAGGSALVFYQITSLVENDSYIMAAPWDVEGETIEGGEVAVAKCLAGRGIDSETIDGIPITYTAVPDFADNLRQASAIGFADEYHVMHPRYVADDSPNALIAVAKIPLGTGVLDADGNQITLLEISPQRFWAYQSDQSGTL